MVPPSGAEWIHEIKHDGFRLMARRDGAGVRLITRKGQRLQRPVSVHRNGSRGPARPFLPDRRRGYRHR
jgi:hypothetical protein